ncbi:unnamed protein product [Parnassius mnemosyne]|uniref:TIL domain-containing protein n=1 Tax=Parnassius mnemosyne TaxID=213953 RepID=A0AAV1MCJ4_9NEOP
MGLTTTLNVTRCEEGYSSAVITRRKVNKAIITVYFTDESMCTRPNEELKCVKSCPPEKTCQNCDTQFECIDNATEICKKECICKEGFYRNNKGDCVTREMCDEAMCTRPNEELKCVKSCPTEKTCQNCDIQFNCIDNATEICKNECICKEGFYRNDKGDCVTKEMCGKIKSIYK